MFENNNLNAIESSQCEPRLMLAGSAIPGRSLSEFRIRLSGQDGLQISESRPGLVNLRFLGVNSEARSSAPFEDRFGMLASLPEEIQGRVRQALGFASRRAADITPASLFVRSMPLGQPMVSRGSAGPAAEQPMPASRQPAAAAAQARPVAREPIGEPRVAAPAGQIAAPEPQASSREVAQFMGLVNDLRRSNGKPALSLSPQLNQLAAEHNRYQVGRNAISHDQFGSRGAAAQQAVPGARTAAENVAFNRGFQDPVTEAFRGLVDSPGHLRNMLADYPAGQTGVDVATTPDGRVYFAQLFVG